MPSISPRYETCGYSVTRLGYFAVFFSRTRMEQFDGIFGSVLASARSCDSGNRRGPSSAPSMKNMGYCRCSSARFLGSSSKASLFHSSSSPSRLITDQLRFMVFSCLCRNDSVAQTLQQNRVFVNLDAIPKVTYYFNSLKNHRWCPCGQIAQCIEPLVGRAVAMTGLNSLSVGSVVWAARNSAVVNWVPFAHSQQERKFLPATSSSICNSGVQIPPRNRRCRVFGKGNPPTNLSQADRTPCLIFLGPGV